jgi:hypothetical protein
MGFHPRITQFPERGRETAVIKQALGHMKVKAMEFLQIIMVRAQWHQGIGHIPIILRTPLGVSLRVLGEAILEGELIIAVQT